MPARQQCEACGRIIHCSKGFCRLCWTEASRASSTRARRLPHADTRHTRQPPTVLRRHAPSPTISPATWASTTEAPTPYVNSAKALRTSRRSRSVPAFRNPRELSRFERPPFSEWFEEALRQPHIALAMRTADRVAGAYGWSSRLRYDVGRGLIVALACRPPDELVPHSELGALTTHLRISVTRVAAVLDEAELLLDDRIDAIEFNWQRRLADVDPAIRRDALDWLARLRNGSPRSKPRKVGTASEILPR